MTVPRCGNGRQHQHSAPVVDAGSVLVDTHGYDTQTGELTATLPDALRAAGGAANLLCHFHDEKLWNLTAIQVKGRLEKRRDAWVFVSTSFTPPARLTLISLMRRMATAANKYLAKRGLERPPVNWAAVKEVQRRARASDRR